MSAVVPHPTNGRNDHGPGPFRCIHCGTEQPTWAHMSLHLARCKARSYPRTFVIGKYRFVVHLNPLKRWVMALKRLAETPKINEQAFVGALLWMKEAGLIHSYEVIPISQAPPLGSGAPMPRA